MSVQGRLVLLVEDEYLTAEDVRQGLEEVGVEVLGPASSVQRALYLLGGDRAPDGAILDVNLGGELVFPVADILRERGISFIFATGFDAWALPAAYADVPRCEKPFSVDRCLQLLFGAGATLQQA